MEISGYEDLEEIGRGGYAVVYRAHQAQFGRQVAIKVLTNPGFGETDRARFEREALAMGRLSWHPNIVVVHETGTTESGLPYLVEEFLEGGSLGDKLRKNGPLGHAEALADMIQLCAAVHTAHEADLLHRDVKPDNALIDTFGRVKLADFGIAAVTGSTLTATGMVTATIAHAAPEVLTGERATFQADVYSLGSTLYELLAGKPAFTRDTDESIVPLVLRVTTDPVPDLGERGVPEPVKVAIEHAMAKDPADRPESALVLGKELQAAQQALGLKVTDLAVRGGPAPRHDETVIGVAPVPPPVVAATPPPMPAVVQPPVPSAPTPEPAVIPPPPQGPPPAPAPAAATTSESPAAAELAAPTGTVAVGQIDTPPPGWPGDVGGPPTPTPKKRSPLLAVLIVLGVLALAGGAFFVLTGDDGDPGEASEDFGSGVGGGVDDGDGGEGGGDPVDIAVGDRPFRVAATTGAVWVTNNDGASVSHIDPENDTAGEPIPIGGEASGVAATDEAVWVANYDADMVLRIDPNTDTIVDTVAVGAGPRNVAVTESAVWVVNLDDDSISRIDPSSNAVVATVFVGDAPRGIVATDDDVWVSNYGAGTVSRIDPSLNTVIDTVEIGGNPGGLGLTPDSVWVTESETDKVVRIDRESAEVTDEITDIGIDPGGMVAVGDVVFVATSGDDTVSRIDDASREVVDTITVGDAPGGLAVTLSDLWVCNTEDDTVTRIPLG